jgi:hypothetical protein
MTTEGWVALSLNLATLRRPIDVNIGLNNSINVGLGYEAREARGCAGRDSRGSRLCARWGLRNLQRLESEEEKVTVAAG